MRLRAPAVRFLATVFTGGMLCVFAACQDAPADAGAGPGPSDSTPPDTVMSPESHGEVPPNYARVFPQDSVNVIEVRMTPAAWTSVQANMLAVWGFPFGGGGTSASVPDEDPDYIDVTVNFNGKAWQHAGFRLKGTSSLSFAWRRGIYKLPFRLSFDEFEDAHPATKNQRFYGFKEVSMAPGYSDNSLIREKLAADLFRQAGVPAARTAFYRVYIDFGAGLKYCGVYTMVEVIDDTMVHDQFGSDAGNIYKPVSAFLVFNPSDFEKKNNKSAADYSDVQAAIAALNAPTRLSDPPRWRADLEATFNVDHFLKWLAINTAIVNWDSYGVRAQNYYLYNHPSAKLTWIPWDHNLSLTGSPGITGTAASAANGLSLSFNEVTAAWPLIRNIIADSVYAARYRSNLRAFRDGAFAETPTDLMIDRYHALIAGYVTGPGGEQSGYTYLTTPTQFGNSVSELKTHMRQRRSLITTFTQ